jgi:hypothetical protein
MSPGIAGHHSYSAFRRDSWDAASTSETYGPGTLLDRSSLGIESETTQSSIGCGTRLVAPCLREARVRGWANPTNSGLFRRARLAGNDTLDANCRTKASVQCDNFRQRFSRCRWPHTSRPCGRDDCSRHARKGARNVIEQLLVTRISVPSAAGFVTNPRRPAVDGFVELRL